MGLRRRTRRSGGLTLALALALSAGCAEGQSALYVDVRTDLSPGNEFASIRTEISREPFEVSGATSEDAVDAFARSEADFVAGVRVADVESVAPGTRYVRVSLLDDRGDAVADRTSIVDVRGRVAMITVISRACRGVECPIPGGDPSLTTCVGGRCETPACTPLTPEACAETPTACVGHGDCVTSVGCARGFCAGSECFILGDHTRCASDEWCDPGVGCVPRAGIMRDGGPMCPATETSCADGDDDDCDGLTDCADPDCVGVACDDGSACTEADVCTDTRRCAGQPIVCDDGNECTDDTCDASSGACTSVPNTAPCDDGFFCNGSDACAAGSCSAHSAPPCGMFCNETTRSCDECVMDSDCGAPTLGAWSACGGYTSTCDESGTRSRSVMTPRCTSGMCTVASTTEDMACARDTDGTSCGSTTYGAWGSCGSFSGTCDESGSQSRSVMRRSCAASSCATQTSSESRACTRASRDGVSCGGGTQMRCCSQTCRNLWTDRAHCGGCGLACTGSLTCRVRPEGGGASCGLCSANSQCPPSGATCWTSAIGGNNLCQCQADSHCAPGQRCYTGSGNNYCYYP